MKYFHLFLFNRSRANGGIRHNFMQLALLIISTFLFLLYATLLIYFRQNWLRIPEYIPASNSNPKTRISIIITARNEEKYIKACLDSITAQLYPKNLFEVLVVDDFSTDATASIVSTYSTQQVKLISLNDFVTEKINSYKKRAIEIAIRHSSGDLIVTTDADCVVPKNWLQYIGSFYEKTNAAFIVMPVNYHSHRNFIEVFQSLDFMTLQGITGAAVHKKRLSMCNGANLAFNKKSFYEVEGFKGIDNIASGDDMLLMHKIFQQQPGKVLYLKSANVTVQTKPMPSLKSFFDQRIRWASKADKYDDKRIFSVLLIVYLFNLLLIVLPVIAFFNYNAIQIQLYPFSLTFTITEFWLLLIISKTIIELFFLYPVAYFFNKQKILWIFPLLQPFHILYTVIAGWLGKFGSYEWKGRRVK